MDFSQILITAKIRVNLKDEVWMVSDFSQILMQEYFLQDSKMDSSEIVKSIHIKRNNIDKSVDKELKNKKYDKFIGKKIIAIAKEHYSNFEKIKLIIK